ncbi:MAG: iron chelate uptake ABC transporter family permease subunit, partial [Planctomycetota bacterium]
MMWSSLDTWIVIVGAMSAAACGLVGAWLVLRRMSLLGDAISHAVLPGLAGAFLFSIALQTMVRDHDITLPQWLEPIIMGNPKSGPIMFLGAAFAGLLTAVFTQWIGNFGRVDRGAAMGVVFTTLFALGLLMMVRAADYVDLDPSCVLYGAVELTPLYTITVLGLDVPRAAANLSVVLAINVIFMLLFYKELKITSFDPELATTLGINAQAMHYALITLVAMTTVASFEAVGSILVIAMLIVPGATAWLLTVRLAPMLLLSVIFAIAAAALGHVSAITVPTWFGFRDTNTAGMMAAMSGLLFVIVMFVSPRQGLVSRALNRRHVQQRIVREDVLSALYRIESAAATAGADHPARVGATASMVETSPLQLAGILQISNAQVQSAVQTLERQGLIARDANHMCLTQRGHELGSNLVRSHRLWEQYLHEHGPVDPGRLHTVAHHLEHVTDQQMQDHLSAAAGHPTHDPHGSEVPQRDDADSRGRRDHHQNTNAA